MATKKANSSTPELRIQGVKKLSTGIAGLDVVLHGGRSINHMGRDNNLGLVRAMLRLPGMRCALAALLAAVLLLLPMSASATSFTFGGDNTFSIQKKGEVDPYQSGVTGTSAGTGDLLMDYYVGLYNFNLFDAIGTSDVVVGDSFTGLNYAISDQSSVNNPNFYVTSDYFRKKGPDKKHVPDSYEMAGSLVLDSVTFDAPFEITLKGFLTDLSFNNATGSAILQDLRGSDTVDFLLIVSASSKTSGQFLPVLQSKNNSTWAATGGTINGGGSPAGAVPEPGTLLLVASSLGGLAAWRRRKKLRSAPNPSLGGCFWKTLETSEPESFHGLPCLKISTFPHPSSEVVNLISTKIL